MKRKICKLLVVRNKVVNELSMMIENYFGAQFNCKHVNISNGKIVFSYFGNEFIEVSFFDLIKRQFVKYELPAGYKEVASLYAVGSISLDQIEEILCIPFWGIPTEFFKEVEKVERAYYEHCKAHKN